MRALCFKITIMEFLVSGLVDKLFFCIIILNLECEEKPIESDLSLALIKLKLLFNTDSA